MTREWWLYQIVQPTQFPLDHPVVWNALLVLAWLPVPTLLVMALWALWHRFRK